tara:strand:- start:12623 stop:14077 length:1455 start_codon:yes stop_codon:yes gene_type:complete
VLLKNILTTGSFNISSQIIIFAVEIFIARMLIPEDFGAFALSLIVIELLSIFSFKYVGLSYIQDQNDTESDLISMVIFSFAISMFLTFVSLYFVENIATFWGGDVFVNSYSAFVYILPVMTLEFIFRSSVLKRKAYFFNGLSEIFSVLAYAVCVITLVYNDFGFLSLIYAYMLRQLLKLVLLFYFTIKEQRFFVTPNFVRLTRLNKMTIALMMQNLFLFFSANTDKYFVNLAAGASGVGLYTRALKLLKVPLNQIVNNVSSVLYVEYSKYQNNHIYLKRNFIITNFLLCLLFLPAITILNIFAYDIVIYIYGIKWIAMVPVLKVLSFGAVISCISITFGDLLKSQGIVYKELFSNIASLIILVITSLLFYKSYGLTGIAWAYVSSQVVFLLLQLKLVSKVVQLAYFSYFRLLILPTFISVIFIIIYSSLSTRFSFTLMVCTLFLTYLFPWAFLYLIFRRSNCKNNVEKMILKLCFIKIDSREDL